MDLSIVTGRLATGGVIWSAQDIDDLVTAGVGAIISCHEIDDAPFLTGHPQVRYLWNSTPDDGLQKPLEWFQASLEFGLDYLNGTDTGILHCHCSGGNNRGPSTVALILMGLGWSKEDAAAAIYAARPRTVGSLWYLDQAAAAIAQIGTATSAASGEGIALESRVSHSA